MTLIITNILIRISLITLIYYTLNLFLNLKMFYVWLSLSPFLSLCLLHHCSTSTKPKKKKNRTLIEVCEWESLFRGAASTKVVHTINTSGKRSCLMMALYSYGSRHSHRYLSSLYLVSSMKRYAEKYRRKRWKNYLQLNLQANDVEE